MARTPHSCTTGHEHYTYKMIGVVWCVTYALELLAEDPSRGREVVNDVTQLDSMIGFPPKHRSVALFGVDAEHAATVDISVPPLVAHLVSAKGEDVGYQIIDGWHRIYKARTLGRTTLPMIVLSSEVEQAARVADIGGLLRSEHRQERN